MVSSPRALYRGVTWQAIITPVRAVPTVCGPRLSEPAEPGTTTQDDPGTRTRGELVAAWDAVLQPQFAGQLAPVMRARVLFNLARALREEVLYEQNLQSADRAIALLAESRTLIPAEAEDWRDATRLLAMVLQDRCDLTGDAGGLRQAADLLREVRDHPAETDVVAASVEASRLACWHLTRRASLALMRRLRSLRRPRR